MYTLQQLNVQRTVATESERDRLLKEGYVELEPEAPQSADTPNDKPVDDMTVAELKDYAEQNSIDLNGATKKEDILSVIKGGGAGGN